VSRRSAVLAAASVPLVAVLAGVVFVLARHEPVAAPAAPAGPAPVAAADAGPDVARALAALATDPASLVSAGDAAALRGRARQAVPTGSRVKVDQGTWRPDGVGGGTVVVAVTPPGGRAASYLAIVVPEGGAWKVLATVPIGRRS
jgi:hypothetical protein